MELLKLIVVKYGWLLVIACAAIGISQVQVKSLKIEDKNQRDIYRISRSAAIAFIGIILFAVFGAINGFITK